MDGKSDEADGLDTKMIRIPLRGKPKPRPRVTSNGTYMPPDYMEWKKSVFDELLAQGLPQAGKIEGNLKLIVRFGSDFMDLQLFKLDEVRAKHVRADVDNLVGGIMDALQDAGIIVNDAQIVAVEAVTWE